VLVEHNGFLRRWVSRILSHVSSPQAVDVKNCIVVTVFCLIDELFKRILVKLANLKQCSIFIDFFHVLMVLMTYLFDTVFQSAPFDLPMLRWIVLVARPEYFPNVSSPCRSIKIEFFGVVVSQRRLIKLL
jgi:hypothetical protein